MSQNMNTVVNNDNNIVFLQGEVSSDIRKGKTKTGNPYCTFSVRTEDQYMDDETEKVKRVTDFHKVIIFGKLSFAMKKFEEGSPIKVKGKLKTSSRDVDGKKSYFTNIQATKVSEIF